MKVKASSWLLAGGFILLGVLLALDLTKVERICADVFIAPPHWMVPMSFVGPWGCVGLAVLGAACVVSGDFWVASRRLIPIFMFALCGMVVYVAIGLFLAVHECLAGQASPNHSVELTVPAGAATVAHLRR